jgi:DNA-binding transcriptional MerR regulator
MKRELPAELSLTALAAALGVSVQTVGRYEREGIIRKLGRGRYSIGCIAEVVKHLQQAARGGSGPSDWQRERTKYMAAKARRAEREEQLFEGSIYPRDLVEAAIGAILTAVRAAFLAIPNKAVPLLEVCRSKADQAEVITDLIHEAMSGLQRLQIEYIDDVAARKRKNGVDVYTAIDDGNDDEQETRPST